jgi:hypothetical protein
MVHRIFVVPGAPRVGSEVIRRQWTGGHPELFTRTPGLAGYVQNRPLPEEWHRLGVFVCAETWFADRQAERAAYASDHYREVVAADEARFLDRDAVWSARVAGPVSLERRSRYRVLVFGDGPLTLSRPAPGGGHGLDVRWFDDRAAALDHAAAAPGLAIATEPAVFPIPAANR